MSKPLRLLLWHEDQRGPGVGGGAESLLRDMANALKARGHSVAWVSSLQIREAVEQFKPDVVHVQTIHTRTAGWGEPMEWLQSSGVPHLWALMDYWPFCGVRMLLTKGVAGHGCAAVKGVCDSACEGGKSPAEFAAIVNNSPVVALNANTADIYRRNGLRCDYVVELGVDTAMFAPDYSRRGEAVSIYTSSAWPEYPVKGMQVIAEAIKGTPYKVQLVTHQPREVVASELKKASVHIFPSIYEETWGLCLNEAMASGCACIASDVAGARAQLHDGLGLLFPPGDSAALREAIERVLGDDNLRAGMGRAAREHVQEEHSLAAMAARWESVYHGVMGG